MTTLIALLRAVNVGGTGKLPMSDLREMCASAGFANARTYIQSGNVVLDSEVPPPQAEEIFEALLASHFGKPAQVMVRTAAELGEILAAQPFAGAAPNQVAVVFAKRAFDVLATPLPSQRDERIVVRGRELYVHYPSGMGQSKLTLPAATESTARNLNTVAKLVAMAAEAPSA